MDKQIWIYDLSQMAAGRKYKQYSQTGNDRVI